MNRCFYAAILGGAAMFLAGADSAQAARTVSLRTQVEWSTGCRQDITVPYLTSWKTTIIPGTYVAPRIYASPNVDDARYPQGMPVFNLIYYGSIQGFGDRSDGAKPRVRIHDFRIAPPY
jgi:hypothetical protein